MASQPKKKKKYTPRAVLVPRIVKSAQAFAPIEDALHHLLASEELTMDENGIFVYPQVLGGYESYVDGITAYLETLKLLRPSWAAKLEPLAQLRDTILLMQEDNSHGVSDAMVAGALKCLELARVIINTSDSNAIMQAARTARDKIREEKNLQFIRMTLQEKLTMKRAIQHSIVKTLNPARLDATIIDIIKYHRLQLDTAADPTAIMYFNEGLWRTHAAGMIIPHEDGKLELFFEVPNGISSPIVYSAVSDTHLNEVVGCLSLSTGSTPNIEKDKLTIALFSDSTAGITYIQEPENEENPGVYVFEQHILAAWKVFMAGRVPGQKS